MTNFTCALLPWVVILTTFHNVFACNSYKDGKKTGKYNRSITKQLEDTQQYQSNNCTEILQMTSFPSALDLKKNGFVHTVVNAYNGHHNLVIRPDDIWAAIMTQFSFYLNKNAEEFRDKFVNFQGKKKLVVKTSGTLRTVSYGELVKLMTKEIDENLIDRQVKKWVLPNFSTTTDNDVVTVGVIFMATLKKYFDYGFELACGIPEITLEGTVDDWKNVYNRLEKLKEYKLEKWYNMLEPVVKQFVNARQGNVDLDFWQRIVHHQRGGSGPSYISGWITVFCAFDQDGNWKGNKRGGEINGEWLTIDSSDVPIGSVEVDVEINDNGQIHNSVMFAGHMATEIKDRGYTVQPILGWVIALKPSNPTPS